MSISLENNTLAVRHAPTIGSSASVNEQTEESHPNNGDLTWLEPDEIIEATRKLFSKSCRLAQEHINWDYMSGQNKVCFD